jgi:hypothetical protein
MTPDMTPEMTTDAVQVSAIVQLAILERRARQRQELDDLVRAAAQADGIDLAEGWKIDLDTMTWVRQ